MSTIFDSIATRSLPESVFDMSHEVKLSMNMGELIPIYLEEIVPGDTFQVQSEILIRLAPMLAPVMHRVKVYTHYFYVPNRLTWDNWHDHITGGEDGLQNPAFPYVAIDEARKANFARGTLADYLGIPTIEPATTVSGEHSVSALPFRAYQLIYNEYYRDQDLSTKIAFSKGDGYQGSADQTNLVQLRQRHWERDYFTSARPNTQKGPEVSIALDQTINYREPAIATSGGTPYQGGGQLQAIQDGHIQANPGSATNIGIDNISSIDASITVESQRVANRMQEWMELAMRGGSRINEVIRNFFGVRPDDLRLTRPQYLGGGMQNVVMSEVLNTAGDSNQQTPGLQPLGDYGGHGISVGNQNGFRERFKEHGYVMGIMSVIPNTAYQQGLHRHWTKFDKYERYWPQFANIGEQGIEDREIYLDYTKTATENKSTFGYAPRYAEYKYGCSKVHGDFRKYGSSVGEDGLSFWHMGRYFDNKPALNQDFVVANPTHRIFAVQDTTVDKLYCQIFHKIKAKRKMPFHNIPSNMPV